MISNNFITEERIYVAPSDIDESTPYAIELPSSSEYPPTTSHF